MLSLGICFSMDVTKICETSGVHFALSEKNLTHFGIYRWAGSYMGDGFILDVGSELGFGSSVLMRPGRTVLGVDINFSTSYFAHNNFSSDDSSFIQADALKLPVSSNSCMGICLVNVLHLVEDPLYILKECYRVLSSQHPLIITIPLDINLPEEWKYPSPRTRLTKELSKVFTNFYFPKRFRKKFTSCFDQINPENQEDGFVVAVCTK